MTAGGSVKRPEVQAWRALQDQLARRGERRLVLVTGERHASLGWLRALLPELAMEHGAWCGAKADNPDQRMAGIQAKQAREWLGRELSMLVWDGWHGNPPDAFAALAGTLQAGGLLFWLMPPLDHWRQFDDPDYRRTALDQTGDHPFAGRMAALLRADASVINVDPEASESLQLPVLAPPAVDFAVAATDGQRALVQQLVRFGLGRRKRPLVVTADRGRGKSAALGLAAAELLRRGRRQILVTAPSRANLDTLFRHARASLAQDLASESASELRTQAGGRLTFLPIGELLSESPEAELVMVDEAAAIPAGLLKRVLLGWPRVAFSSTVHGYEGAGRGFAIRFRQILDRHTPQWQAHTLAEPVRWAPGDPLEALVAKLFLLAAANPAPAAALDATTAGALSIEPWAPAEATEAELSEAFGLLVEAHYRTSPADLRQWLDDPAVRTWRARQGGNTVGILWAAVEGGLEQELAGQVTLGRRRVRGHLLPQSLASHGGLPEAAAQRCLRVVRIAVADEARRLGVGRRLVAAAGHYVSEQRLDSLGTSFGGSSDLFAFWQSCGLELVRVGLQAEACSGEYPLQMLQGHSGPGRQLVERLRCRLAEHWLTLVPLAWPALEPQLLTELTEALPKVTTLSEEDLQDLASFGHGFRGFLLSLPVLRKVNLAISLADWLSHPEDVQLWGLAVLQGQSWHRLQLAGVCRGQRDAEERLRGLVRQLLRRRVEL